MVLTPGEEKVLRRIAEVSLATKAELKAFLKNNGMKSNDVNVIVESATKSLLEKKLITSINPIGSTCYVITQKGMRVLEDLE